MIRTVLQAREEHGFSADIIREFLSMVESSEKMLAYTFKILSKGGKGKTAADDDNILSFHNIPWIPIT